MDEIKYKPKRVTYEPDTLLARMTPLRDPEIIQERKPDQYVYTINQTIVTDRAKFIDDEILKTMYEAYKDIADEIIVLNETEFEKFIRKYLPLYMKLKEGNACQQKNTTN